jgi:hypothetical protein
VSGVPALAAKAKPAPAEVGEVFAMELPTDSKVSVLTYKSFAELNNKAAARAIFQRLVQLAVQATLRHGVTCEVRVVAISSEGVSDG